MESNNNQQFSDPHQTGYSSPCIDRLPQFAGRFYPSSEKALREELEKAFHSAGSQINETLRALIVPHAGYVYSGEVAAYAYAQIPENYSYQRIFILASSHRHSFPGAAIYYQGDYLTPLGRVAVDTLLGKELQSKNEVFSFDAQAHIEEHSLEVQLPFLQYKMNRLPLIVPIIIGTQQANICQKIADALKPFFIPENLFIVSSDFSHYPSFRDAIEVDQGTAEAIAKNDPGQLLQTLQSNDRKGIPGLATSLCGWTSVLTLLYLTEDHPSITYHLLKYRNSGHSGFGDKEGVVGYYALAITEKQATEVNQLDEGSEHFLISDKEKKRLLEITREALEDYLINNTYPKKAVFDDDMTGLSQVAGAFVSLHNGKTLRGCIGRFDTYEPLWKVVQNMAIAAANDSRFKPVAADELQDIDIEISILSPLKRISGPQDIVIGKHGIYMTKGMAAGTLLPQVAVQYGWAAAEFLGYCARDKANIGWEGWYDAELYSFEAVILHEKQS